MTTHNTLQPTHDERRRAVVMTLSWAPGLIRFAARYTGSLEDAEDAYQRAMEIALESAPETDPERLITWLHTVIRREAAVISRGRMREQPVSAEDLEETLAASGAQAPAPDAVVEWRERLGGLQDACNGLTHEQRVCLLLRSSGFSRPEIQEMTGLSVRRVHRAIIDGRQSLSAWEVRMISGEECASIRELIDTVLDGDSSALERRRLARHIRHCRACGASFRTRRDQLRLLGSLVPTVLLGAEMLQASPPDPSVALTWWERVSASATVRSAQAVQVVMDLPALASTKAGAGAIAAAAAGALGTPLAIEAVQTRRAEPPAIGRAAPTTPAAPTITQSPTGPRIVIPPPARPRAAPKAAAAATPNPKPRPAPRPTRRSTQPAAPIAPTPTRSTQRPRAQAAPSPALEFGP